MIPSLHQIKIGLARLIALALVAIALATFPMRGLAPTAYMLGAAAVVFVFMGTRWTGWTLTARGTAIVSSFLVLLSIFAGAGA